MKEKGKKAELSVFGIVECNKKGKYKGSVTAAMEKNLEIYRHIFENQGEMVSIPGSDGKMMYFRLKGKE